MNTTEHNLKLKGHSKDRSPKPFELGDATFYVKPLDRNSRTVFESRSYAGSAELFTYQDKRYFAERNLTDWQGVESDDGKQLEYSKENAIEALTDDDNDDLFYELYNYAYKLAVTSDKSQEEDAESAKKK